MKMPSGGDESAYVDSPVSRRSHQPRGWRLSGGLHPLCDAIYSYPPAGSIGEVKYASHSSTSP